MKLNKADIGRKRGSGKVLSSFKDVIGQRKLASVLKHSHDTSSQRKTKKSFVSEAYYEYGGSRMHG